MRGTKPERSLERIVANSRAIKRGEKILVACSGGPDSIALAAVLKALAKRFSLQLALAHVNHGVRSSSWQDEAVVLYAGASLGLPVKTAQLRLRRKDEATLREARYDALARIAQELCCDAIATGHTASDQTETVLLALFRGSGPAGLAGMPPRRQLDGGIELIRPMLRADRSQIVSYIQRLGFAYAIDPTNADTLLRRNAVRTALQALRPVFPGLDEAVARAAEIVGAELSGAAAAAARRQVREALRENRSLKGVDFEHVEAAVRALQSGRSGRFSMGGGVEVAVAKGALTVRSQT